MASHHKRDGTPKVGYQTEADAKYMIRVMSARNPGTARLDAYRCDICNEWHTGNSGLDLPELDLGRHYFAIDSVLRPGEDWGGPGYRYSCICGRRGYWKASEHDAEQAGRDHVQAKEREATL